MSGGDQIRARVNPEGFVAQRMPVDINGHGHWVLTSIFDGQVKIEALDDDQVSEWPELTQRRDF